MYNNAKAAEFLKNPDMEELFNPKPVGEPVNHYVQEAVQERRINFDQITEFVKNPNLVDLFNPVPLGEPKAPHVRK